MPEAITDRHVVAVLRPFVRASGPLVDRLREIDPFGLRDGELGRLKMPGTAGWAAMTPDQRDDWWVSRVGRFTSLLAAAPGVGGALADRLPIQDALGCASQGLLLCALAGEHGFTSVEDRVRLLAWVLFERDVDPTPVEPDEDAKTEELRTEGSTVKAVAGTVWKLGRMLWGLGNELGKRPQGLLHHKALGMLPVVGVVGDYLGERSALRRVRRRALHWFDR